MFWSGLGSQFYVTGTGQHDSAEGILPPQGLQALLSLEGHPLSLTFWESVTRSNLLTQVSSLRSLSSFRQVVIWPIHAKVPSSFHGLPCLGFFIPVSSREVPVPPRYCDSVFLPASEVGGRWDPSHTHSIVDFQPWYNLDRPHPLSQAVNTVSLFLWTAP